MRLPPLQTLLIDRGCAACVSDKFENYEYLECLPGHMCADMTKGQQQKLDITSANNEGGTIPFSSALNQPLFNIPWLNK